MRKRDLTVEELERRKKVGERVKAYRTSRGWTQRKCAEEWELGDEITIRRLEMNIDISDLDSEAHPATKKTAQKIAKHTTAIWQFWFGITDLSSREFYDQWAAEAAAEEKGFAEFLVEEEKRIMKTEEFYNGLLNPIGFQYKNASRYAAFDFLGVAPGTEAPAGEHMITPLDNSAQSIYFSDADLDGLLSDLKDLVAFRCFQQQSRNRR